MKTFLFVSIIILWTVSTFSQTRITGTIKDSETKEPLAFCSIAIKNTNKGAITNTDGVFIITVNLQSDVLIFSYLGYGTKTIHAAKLQDKNTVFLNKSNYEIDVLTIYSGTDYLYDIMAKCRKQIKRNYTEKTAKVYYGLKTQTNDKPLELLECYYNGSINGYNIDELYYKNGRVAYANVDNYFFSLNTSKIITLIQLIHNNSNLPYLPFQFNKFKMKKKFTLKMKNSNANLLNIEFTPISNNNAYFKGEVWIEKETYNLLKIKFSIENARRHPFLPLMPMDSVYSINMQIINSYKKVDNDMLVDYVNFKYSFKYLSVRDSTTSALVHKIITRNIETRGIVDFFDFNTPFILPYFEYDNNFTDYRKMSFIPYNKEFWDSNNNMLLTIKQKENLDYFTHYGELINYEDPNYNKTFLNNILDSSNTITSYGFYNLEYLFWSKQKRIQINNQTPMGKTFSAEIINRTIQRDLYNLKVQILLDVTQIKDSLHCRSFTIFDPSDTYYHLPEQEYTNAFMNIYFDICEIERQKMQKEIDSNNYTVSQIDSLFYVSKEKMEDITNLYLKEVMLGKKKKEFNKWNNYVYDNLGIDNIKMFKERGKNKK